MRRSRRYAPIAVSNCGWPRKRCAIFRLIRGCTKRWLAYYVAKNERNKQSTMASAVGPDAKLDLWPYEEARKLADRVRNFAPERSIIFQSGFGPSGLPHLGTMGEVLRPAFVRHALTLLGETHSSRLIVFIDDMDGLRKVPEIIPNREVTARYLGYPVSRIPDPFGDRHDSFASHMIGQLGGFLAPVEVAYELMRSSEMYARGAFDDALRLILAKHQEIVAIIAPTLREENRTGWLNSPANAASAARTDAALRASKRSSVVTPRYSGRSIGRYDGWC
jgi:lysyl-tRNA synthetase class I